MLGILKGEGIVRDSSEVRRSRGISSSHMGRLVDKECVVTIHARPQHMTTPITYSCAEGFPVKVLLLINTLLTDSNKVRIYIGGGGVSAKTSNLRPIINIGFLLVLTSIISFVNCGTTRPPL